MCCAETWQQTVWFGIQLLQEKNSFSKKTLTLLFQMNFTYYSFAVLNLLTSNKTVIHVKCRIVPSREISAHELSYAPKSINRKLCKDGSKFRTNVNKADIRQSADHGRGRIIRLKSLFLIKNSH